jgi:hypothetical protein
MTDILGAIRHLDAAAALIRGYCVGANAGGEQG